MCEGQIGHLKTLSYWLLGAKVKLYSYDKNFIFRF